MVPGGLEALRGELAYCLKCAELECELLLPPELSPRGTPEAGRDPPCTGSSPRASPSDPQTLCWPPNRASRRACFRGSTLVGCTWSMITLQGRTNTEMKNNLVGWRQEQLRKSYPRLPKFKQNWEQQLLDGCMGPRWKAEGHRMLSKIFIIIKTKHFSSASVWRSFLSLVIGAMVIQDKCSVVKTQCMSPLSNADLSYDSNTANGHCEDSTRSDIV